MSPPLRVLFVEDCDNDVVLQTRELRRAGYEIESHCVENESDLRHALDEHEWDLVLSDYTLPRFNGLQALKVVRETGRDIPFILLSGTVGEDVAVESMRAGAADFLLKNNLTRLAPAVGRELWEAAQRRQRRQAEQALVESQTLLSLIYDHTSEMLVLFSASDADAAQPQWCLRSANRAWLVHARTLGQSWQMDDVRGWTPTQLFDALCTGGEECQLLSQAFAEAAAGQRPVAIDFSWRPAAETIFTEQRFIPVANDQGGRYVLWASRDVSERRRAEDQRRRLEAQLLQAQKLEALGTLASSIAHDFNNILTGLGGYAEMIRLDTADMPDVQAMVGAILQGIHRATDLSGRILSFGRKRPGQRQPGSLGPVVHEALEFLRPLIPGHIRVQAELPTEGPTVLLDVGQIHQAVINLCTNAVQAMSRDTSRKARLEVSLAAVHLDEDFTREHAPLRPGSHVRLRVSDTGTGMEEAALARLFEPFFTTRPVGTGAGLGMTVVQGVVKSHHGAIVVNSRPGEGTQFDLYFPTLADGCPSRASPEQARKGPRLLFVDDEEYLAHLGETMLSRMGYAVTPFTDPQKALEAFLAAPEAYAALLTDLNMPGMRGVDLAERMRQRRPDLPVILTTGYSGPHELDRARGLGFRDVLDKPFTVEKLAEMLVRILPARSV